MSGTPENMDPKIHREHARDAGLRIVAVGESTDLAARVPRCDDWDLSALLLHVGGFCRNVRSSLAQGTTIEPRGFPDIDLSDYGSDGDHVAWVRQEHDRLMATLDDADPDEPNWSWGLDQRKAFWFRRAAQELAIHCWDAEGAAGAPAHVDPELAADGIDELLIEFGRVAGTLRSEGLAKNFDAPGTTLHFHATDVSLHPGEWMVTVGDEELTVIHEHGKGDVAVRGPASAILLALWGRLPFDGLDLHGDAAILERWQERARI